MAAVVAAQWTHPDGAAVAEEEIHLWTLDSNTGLVVGFRHHVDTSQHLIAAGLDRQVVA